MPKPSLPVVALLLLLRASAFAYVTSDEPGSHTTTPGQLSFGIDVDGVAVVSFDVPTSRFDDLIPYCSAALITDRHVLSAAYCFDEDMDGQVDPLLLSVPTVVAFEPAGQEPVLLGIHMSSIQFPPRWPQLPADLAILPLVQDAPDSLPRYPLYGRTDAVGRRAVLVGYGQTGSGITGEDLSFPTSPPVKRAGLNRYDAVRDDLLLAYDFDSGLPENNAMALIGFASDLGFGGDEVLSGTGDSGGPGFAYGAIAAVTSFGDRDPLADINDQLDSSWGEAGFDVRVSQFRQFLTDATDGEAIFLDALGDFDFDGALQAADIDSLSSQIRAAVFLARYDINDDGALNDEDRDTWVKRLKETWYGDTNLDGEFNSGDLVAVFKAGEYEDSIEGNSGWAEGDWNADGDFASGDLVVAFQDGGYEMGRREPVAAVPETSGVLSVSLAMIALSIVSRTRRKAV